MTPDDPLLKILACPLDKGPLHLLVPEDVLYNPRLRRRYPIVDGIPQLLPSLGEQVTDDEHERLLKRLAELPDEAGPGAGGERDTAARAHTGRIGDGDGEAGTGGSGDG